MNRDAIEFWSLLIVISACSLAPINPPLLLLWVAIALVWDRRCGPSWYRVNPETREDHFFILDFLVCLPVALVSMLAVLLSRGGRDD